ncbi:uncharacterized protein J7T54_000566 [Emericellopsis cladophorae]|uniref:Uncharacterized protein n=1 Tax=Emericellopsis cladophorae TaxID=2686198 RepID=A0A9Q0BG81_9HYPO|nr:uncharacterized protein J7T54_000566 [Emericellopsis cladophorae]KAI6783064.1 hypothetical protein J7T54_000566 [Emericellopsis cladophorae]
MTAVDVLSKEQFEELVDSYPQALECIGALKTAKDGQRPLSELDAYRYDKAPRLFSAGESVRDMDLEAVKTLVEWKLRHGKFRPTLMSLVSSNDPVTVRNSIRDAIGGYREDGDAAAAVDALSKLRGVGPATASLLLSVHDPDRVIFFSDEAYFWLCCGGMKSPIKYNAKEYQQLLTQARELAARIKVSTTEVEKAAFVAMRLSADVVFSKTSSSKTARAPTNIVKRKKTPELDQPKAQAEPPRRSKRRKA